MGLIKAGIGAIGSTLADQWKEYFICEALDKDTLVVKGEKKTGNRSQNNGNDNIISNGSGIVVADGQCMIIVEQGKVVEICAEPGQFTYDTSSEPSVFAGKLGTSILDTFKTIGRRFSYGADTGKDQRVYYFNTKEILENKFGTPNPIPFRVVDRNIGLDIDVSVRCSGIYSYKIANPILFYTNVCGNIADCYKRSGIDAQLKTEFISSLQSAFAKISSLCIRPNEIPAHAEELCSAMNEALTSKWAELRGLCVVTVAMNPVTLPEEDAEMIKQLQKSAVMRDPSMAGATLVGAQADAMRAAAENKNGAMAGFMGLGMAQGAMGNSNVGTLYAMGASSANANPNANADSNTWKCPKCGKENKGNFCSECGEKRVIKENNTWKCPKCGKENSGNFCSECGEKRPENNAVVSCPKCNFKFEDPQNPPKFCPECGNKTK